MPAPHPFPSYSPSPASAPGRWGKVPGDLSSGYRSSGLSQGRDGGRGWRLAPAKRLPPAQLFHQGSRGRWDHLPKPPAGSELGRVSPGDSPGTKATTSSTCWPQARPRPRVACSHPQISPTWCKWRESHQSPDPSWKAQMPRGAPPLPGHVRDRQVPAGPGGMRRRPPPPHRQPAPRPSPALTGIPDSERSRLATYPARASRCPRSAASVSLRDARD